MTNEYTAAIVPTVMRSQNRCIGEKTNQFSV